MNEKLQFTVTGDFITNFAREKYKESANIEDGVNTLMLALPGFDSQNARDVVLGRKKLIGDSNDGVMLEDDNIEVRPYRFLRPNQPNEIICGWISPSGELYGHDYYNSRDNHVTIAKALLDSKMVVSKGHFINPESHLEHLGWIKFSPYEASAFVGPGKITAAQFEALKQWMSCNAVMALTLKGVDYSYEQIKSMELLQFSINVSLKF